MSFVRKFGLKLYVPEHVEVAADMVERWVGNLKNAAPVINDRRKEKIPDDATFISRLAGPSTEGFASFVPDDFVSRSDRRPGGIKGSHSTNLAAAFNRWNDELNRAFATVDGVPAKKFGEEVEASKDRWALQVGAKTLRLTGDKIRGRGVAPIASFYLVGDKRASGFLRPDDVGDGAPYDIAKPYQRVALKAAVQQRLIQGGMMVINQAMQASAITDENTTNTELLNGLRDPAKCEEFVVVPAADKCWCVWVVDPETRRFYLWIEVGLIVP